MKALVSSAARGADLLALEEAGNLGMRRRCIPPFNRKRFRETSVVDQPGDWGNLYERIVDAVEANGVLELIICDRLSYSRGSQVSLDQYPL